ncbi:MAG TPA: hypothetical protein VFT36_01450 [Methylomirabilota bacterium]|nr:hypothetical protein [Methylomirabilota bacterium]
MKRKASTKKKASPARGKSKAVAKPTSRKAPAKAPAGKPTPAAEPKVEPYTPKPIEGIGWAPFRYTR